MGSISPEEFNNKGIVFNVKEEEWFDDKGKPNKYWVSKISYNGGKLKWMDESKTGGVTEGKGYALQHPIYVYADPQNSTKEEKTLVAMYEELWSLANEYLFEHRDELGGRYIKCKTLEMWTQMEMVPKPIYYPKIKDDKGNDTEELDKTRSPTIYTKLYMSKPKIQDEDKGKPNAEPRSIIYTKYRDACVLNEDFDGKDEDYEIQATALKGMTTTQISEVWIGDLYISNDKIRWRQTITEGYVSEVAIRESGAKKQAKKFAAKTGKKYTQVEMPKAHPEGDIEEMHISPPTSPNTADRKNTITINSNVL